MTAPAGWYPSPDEPGQQRWWDGELWSEHRRRPPRVQYRPHDPTRPEPGWYPAPGEPGMLRFWEGTYWLDLRLPATDATPGDATAGQVLGSIATQLVDNYVRPSLAPGRPGAGPPPATPVQDTPGATAWQPQAAGPPGATPWQPQPAGPLPPPALRQVEHRTSPLRTIPTTTRRGRRSSPVSSVVIGVVLLVLSPVVVPRMLDAARVDPGEALVTGTVVEAQDTGRNCRVTVEYVADGTTYTTTETDRRRTCPGVGTSESVVFELADPADAEVGRPGSGLAALVVPVLGLGMLASGVWHLVRGRRP